LLYRLDSLKKLKFFNMADKRKFTRYRIEARVSFKPEKDITKSFKSQVIDISILGWSTDIEESIDLNTVIQFDLTSYSLTRHLIGKGKITNITEQKTATGNIFRIGVEFIEADKQTILVFINEDQRIKRMQQSRPQDAGFF
jgi:hypothetical protein